MKIRIAALVAVLAVSAVAVVGASAGPPPPATGTQYVASNPGVYGQTTSEYTSTGWSWVFDTSPPGNYYWYLFTSGGTLQASGGPTSSGGSTYPPANIYYWKEYNASNHLLNFNVSYCC